MRITFFKCWAVLALAVGIAGAQQINPNQIRPSSTNGYVLCTVDGTTQWALCGSTLPSGTTNQLLYYSSSGTTVSPLTLGTNLSITGGTLNATGGGSSVWSALTNPTGNLSLTMGSNTSTFANTLPFTTGQFNQNWILNSGSVNFASEFQGFQNAFTSGTYYASDEENIGLNVPSSSSSYQADGLGFYLTCASTTTDCVPFYTQGHRTATGAPVWGANVNAWDGGFGGANMFGFEIDDIVGNTTTTGEDLRILTKVIPGATFQGIHFVPATGVLTNAILLDNSVATNAMNIGEAVGGATSMPILMTNENAVGTFEYNLSGFSFSTNQTLSSIPIYSSFAPSAPNGGLIFGCFGVSNNSNDCVNTEFYYASDGAGTNRYGITFSYGAEENWAIFPNYSTEFGETTAAAGPANGIAVGTSGQATIDGSGNGTFVGIAGSGLLGISNPTASSSLLEGSFYAPSLNTGGQMYFNFGEAATTNNSVYQAFHYAGSGSASNWYGSSFAGVTANNYALWPNASAVFGETAPAAGPANGIAVGSAGNAQIDGSGNISTAAVAAATSSTTVSSPNMVWTGHYWNGTTSASDTWTCTNTFNTAAGFTNPPSVLTCTHAGSSGGGTFQVGNFLATNINAPTIGVYSGNLNLPSATVATSGTNYPSSIENWQDAYYDGSTHQTSEWSIQAVNGTGANPTQTLQLTRAGAGSGAQLIDFSAEPIKLGSVYSSILSVQGSPGNLANSANLSFGSGTAFLDGYGTNPTTQASVAFRSVSSNASLVTTDLTLTPTLATFNEDVTVRGTAIATGNLVAEGNVQIGSAGAVNSGTTAPSGSCGIGDLYTNTGATSASTVLYVCYPSNTWTAVTVP